VPFALAEEMRVTSIAFPKGVEEPKEAGLSLAPSMRVGVPRIAEAPVSMECIFMQEIALGSFGLVLGGAVAASLLAGLICFAGEPMRGGGQLMQTTSLSRRDENTIEASVTIRRTVDDVFGFYRDFKNLPRFLGDVMAIEQIGPATSRWTIQGPFGIRTTWTIRVTEERTNELIRYETVTSPGLRTYWEMHFAVGPEAGDTEVREVMKMPLGRLGRVALALIGKFPTEEVTSNLHRLKELMETGRVSDTSYSVAGKFSHQNERNE